MNPSAPANVATTSAPTAASTAVATPWDAAWNWVGIGNGVIVQITMTDDEYWASQPLAVQALRPAPGTLPNANAAMALALQGYPIDVVIMALGGFPTVTMATRLWEGWTSVPSAFQAVPLPPGLTEPGNLTYNPKIVPPGYIPVSVASSAYPPAVPPTPVTPSAVSLVGPGFGGLVSGNLSPAVLPSLPVWSMDKAGYYLTEGQMYTDPTDGLVYMAHYLGTSLMAPNSRVGVFIGPQPA